MATCGDSRPMKISISRITLRGEKRFMVSWKQPGQRRERRYFAAKVAADALVNELRGQIERAGLIWQALSASDRNTLIAAAEDAKQEVSPCNRPSVFTGSTKACRPCS